MAQPCRNLQRKDSMTLCNPATDDTATIEQPELLGMSLMLSLRMLFSEVVGELRKGTRCWVVRGVG